MAAAGGGGTSVTVPDAVKDAYRAFKQRRTARWMTFRLDADRFELEVAASGGTSAPAAAAVAADAAAFGRALPDSEARYGVFDLPITNKYGGSGSKLLLFIWCPPTAGRSNVLYVAQRGSLREYFSGVEDRQVATRKAVADALAPASAAKEDSDFDPDA
jgi:hypothetical protein